MRLFTWRFLTLTAILAIINIVGLVLIARQSSSGGSSPAASDPNGPGVLARPESATPATPATPARPLQLIGFHPEDDAAAADADRVLLSFDRPVVSETAVGEPVAIEPFTIEPRPAGRWTWVSREQLAFLPDEPLPPGHRYVVKPADNLVAALGQPLAQDGPLPRTLGFATARLTARNALLRSSDADSAVLELVFSHAVDPEDLQKHLEVVVPGVESPLTARVLSTVAGRMQVVQVDDISRRSLWERAAALDRTLVGDPEQVAFAASVTPGSLEVRLSTGLSAAAADPAADRGLAADWAARVERDPPLALRDVSYEESSRRDELGPRIEVSFSRPLAAAQEQDPLVLAAIVVEPPVADLRIRVADRSLMLQGTFTPRTEYLVRLPADLRDADGHRLDVPFEARVVIPGLSPEVSLAMSRGVLMPTGNLLLDLTATNVPTVAVSAERVFENTLVSHLHGDRRWRNSRSVPVARTLLEIPGVRDEPSELALDLRAMLAGGGEIDPGIYRVEVRDPSMRWRQDSAVVVVSDLGLTTRRERDGYLAWVSSLSGGDPVSGATVTAFSAANQMLGQAVTDTDGVARLILPDIGPGEDAWVITASRGTDTNYVQPDRRTLVLDHVDQNGRPHPDSLEAMLYAERGAYRPGDLVHLTAIVRGGDGSLPPAVPMAFSITRPDGREVARIPVEVDPATQGFVHAQWQSPADGQVGRHVARLLPPGSLDPDDPAAHRAQSLGSTAFLVEEFERVRLEVEAAFTQRQFLRGEPVQLGVTARSMFGTPATGLPVRFTAAARIRPFSSIRHPEMHFGAGHVRQTHRIRQITGVLDEAGGLEMTIPGPDAEKATPARWRITGDVSVTQTGGRTISRWVDGSLDTAEGFLGLGLGRDLAGDGAQGGTVSGWLPVGTPTEHAWVCVSGDDEPLERSGVTVTLERLNREMVLQDVRGRLQWRTVERTEQLEQWNFEDAASTGRFAVTPPAAGRYRLTVAGGPRDAIASMEFHAAEDDARFAALANERPERIELSLDKKDFRPGETAVLSMRSAFTGGGTALVTLETDRVLAHRVVSFTGRDGQVELPLDESIRGGAFITVSMVRAIDPGRDSWLPHRAAGMIRVPMSHELERLAMSVDAPSETRPGTEVPVRLQVTGDRGDAAAPAMAHIWAVDEGLLQVTLHRTPDPHAHFLGARRSGVRTSDIFGDLLPDHARPESVDRIGGDEDEADIRRRGVVRRPREIPAVLWRTAVPVASDGTVSLTLPVPAMQGRLRLMAVAVDGDRYGSAEHGLVVAAPVTVESSWPRSVADGDRFEVAVTATNRTAGDLVLPLAVQADGPLWIDPAALQEPLRLPAGGSAVRWLAVEARGIGPVSVRVRLGDDGLGGVLARPEPGALDAGETPAPGPGPASAPAPETLLAEESATLAVRLAGILQTRARLLSVAAGETLEVDPAAGFLPGTATVRLEAAGDTAINLLPAVGQLLEYPHGCAEQTASRLVSLLAVAELLASAGPAESGRRDAYARHLIAAGFDRMATMQAPDGGIAYWPGGTRSHAWLTAYVGWMLLEARDAGHELPPGMLEGVIDRLEAALSSSAEADADETRAFICRVLGAAGRPQPAWIAGLEVVADRMDFSGRSHLAVALMDLGRRDRAMAVLGASDQEPPRLESPPSTSGRLTSDIRHEAVLLEALLRIAPEHPWTAVLARRLESRRIGGQWGTTLANAAAVHALARHQSLAPTSGPLQGWITVGGSDAAEVTSVDGSGPVSLRWTPEADAPPVRLAVDAAGAVDASAAVDASGAVDVSGAVDASDAVDAMAASAPSAPAPAGPRMHVALITEGLVPASEAEASDRGIFVRRQWRSPDGEPVDPASLRVGDLVVVEVTVQLTPDESRTRIDNIAVVDLLPGACEPENPRIASSGRQRSGSDSVPSRVQFLDDRVVFFVSAGRQPRSWEYAIRVTTAGDFRLPPIQASCMYDPMAASTHGGGRVVVSR